MNRTMGKRRRPESNVYAASTWPGDAIVWMEVAVRLNFESGRPRNDDHSNTNHYQLNVAHVCTGLAFELAYKSLLVAEFMLPKRTHSIKKLHHMLPNMTQEKIARWFKEADWEESEKLLDYLDERISDPDRKYWMENPWERAKREWEPELVS